MPVHLVAHIGKTTWRDLGGTAVLARDFCKAASNSQAEDFLLLHFCSFIAEGLQERIRIFLFLNAALAAFFVFASSRRLFIR